MRGWILASALLLSGPALGGDWQERAPLPRGSVIAAVPHGDALVVASSWSPPGANQAQSEILRSEDCGRTWQAPVATEVRGATALASDGQSLVLASFDGLRRSSDGGRSWSPDGPSGQARDVTFVADAFWAGVEGRVWKSASGAAWTEVGPALPDGRIARAVDLHQDGTVLVGTSIPNGSGLSDHALFRLNPDNRWIAVHRGVLLGGAPGRTWIRDTGTLSSADLVTWSQPLLMGDSALFTQEIVDLDCSGAFCLAWGYSMRMVSRAFVHSLWGVDGEELRTVPIPEDVEVASATTCGSELIVLVDVKGPDRILALPLTPTPPARVRAAMPTDPAVIARLPSMTPEARCEAGEAQGCFEWAHGLLSEKGDAEGAVRALDRACAGSHAAGCSALGAMVITGNGAPLDPNRAGELLWRACDLGDGGGCLRLAQALERELKGASGPSSSELYARAIGLFEEDIAMGQPRALAWLGWMAERGQGGPADPSRAGDLYRRACEAGVAEACGEATRLGR